MRIRTEIRPDGEDEIVLYCRKKTPHIDVMETALNELVCGKRELLLHKSGAECYVPIAEILFFEASNKKVYAHTASGVFTAEYKLFELENHLPSIFVRVSKSAIVNVLQIASLRRELVGNGELTFKTSERKAYFSRNYYHVLKDKIDEIRLNK